MRSMGIAAVLAVTLGLSACTGMNNKQQSALSGGAIGAGVGAAGAAITGGSLAGGAALGGAVGAAGGYLKEELQD